MCEYIAESGHAIAQDLLQHALGGGGRGDQERPGGGQEYQEHPQVELKEEPGEKPRRNCHGASNKYSRILTGSF